MDLEVQENNGCDYCTNDKHFEEEKEDTIYGMIWGKHLRIIGQVGDRRFIRDYPIKYCLNCGREL